MVEIEWQEPPGHVRGDVKWRLPILEELKANPGVWARVERGRKSRHTRDQWSNMGCDAGARRYFSEEEGRYLYNIYARWPEPDPAEVDPYIARRRARGVPRDGR